jgi:hypothetical protein
MTTIFALHDKNGVIKVEMIRSFLLFELLDNNIAGTAQPKPVNTVIIVRPLNPKRDNILSNNTDILDNNPVWLIILTKKNKIKIVGKYERILNIDNNIPSVNNPPTHLLVALLLA